MFWRLGRVKAREDCRLSGDDLQGAAALGTLFNRYRRAVQRLEENIKLATTVAARSPNWSRECLNHIRVETKFSTSTDIAVVGAGISGLVLALKLSDLAHENGLPSPNIEILEADERVGGRVKTVVFESGVAAEEGGQWFHGGKANPFAMWLHKRYDFLCFNEDRVENLNSLFENAANNPNFRQTATETLYNQYKAFKENSPEQDLPLKNLADMTNDPEARLLAEYMTRNWIGLEDPGQVSCDEFFGDSFGPGGLQIKEGLNVAIEAMAKELRSRGVRIQTGCRIVSVEQTKNSILLTDQKGRKLRAKEAALTVSIGVLQRGAIQFKTPLSVEAEARIHSLTMARMTKLLVFLEEEFFEKNEIKPNTHIDILETNFLRFCHARSAGKPIVSIFVSGDVAEQLETQSNHVIRQFIDDSFRHVPVLKGYESYLGDFIVSRWNTNPLAYGTYSACKPHYKRSGPIRDGRLTIAGEAFAGQRSDNPGTMMGAWNSGQKAADEIFSRIKPTLAVRKVT